MTKRKLFFILIISSVAYTLLVLPASFLAFNSPFIRKGELSGSAIEWINYIAIISFPAVVLTGIFSAWSTYFNDELRWSLFCIAMPLINLLVYALTSLF